jgi:hypothetical protein
MLWHKAWIETRWRFLVGLGLLTLSVCGTVFSYPAVLKLLPAVPPIDATGELGRRVREGVELAREYRGFVWSQWFRANMTQGVTLFAVLLGTGGILTQPSGAGALFTLSLPASRNRIAGIRFGAGLSEFLLLAIVPSLALPLLSPAVGQHYGVGDALVHAACQFVGGAVFFCLAFLLSTVFTDLWRPLLIACAVAAGLSMFETVFADVLPVSLFGVMSGETFFRAGRLPWLGLAASAAISTLMMYAAAQNIARQDF